MCKVAHVCDQDVEGALVQEDGVEVVVAEEDCQLILPQTAVQPLQTRVGELVAGALQKALQQACFCCILGFLHTTPQHNKSSGCTLDI